MCRSLAEEGGRQLRRMPVPQCCLWRLCRLMCAQSISRAHERWRSRAASLVPHWHLLPVSWLLRVFRAAPIPSRVYALRQRVRSALSELDVEFNPRCERFPRRHAIR